MVQQPLGLQNENAAFKSCSSKFSDPIQHASSSHFAERIGHCGEPNGHGDVLGKYMVPPRHELLRSGVGDSDSGQLAHEAHSHSAWKHGEPVRCVHATHTLLILTCGKLVLGPLVSGTVQLANLIAMIRKLRGSRGVRHKVFRRCGWVGAGVCCLDVVLTSKDD